MKRKLKFVIPAMVAAAGLVASTASADMVSINFIDAATPSSTMIATDVAGAAGVAAGNWNNYDSGATLGLLLNDAGVPTTASVSTTGGLGDWRLGHTATTGEDKMWKGFFETDGSVATITLSALTYPEYDVYVYFDGANDSFWRTANYSIGGDARNGIEDSENTNWGTGQNINKVYQLPDGSGNANGNAVWPVAGQTNNEGNYLRFSGLSGAAFTLNFDGGGAATGTQRAVVNGLQIVAVPEPSSIALLGIGCLALWARRRRK